MRPGLSLHLRSRRGVWPRPSFGSCRGTGRQAQASTRDGTPESMAAMITASALVMQFRLTVMRRAMVLAEGLLCSCCLLTTSNRRRRLLHSPTARRNPPNPWPANDARVQRHCSSRCCTGPKGTDSTRRESVIACGTGRFARHAASVGRNPRLGRSV